MHLHCGMTTPRRPRPHRAIRSRLLRTSDRSVTPATTTRIPPARGTRRSRCAGRLRTAATASMIRRRRPLHATRSLISSLVRRCRSFIPPHSRRPLSPICRSQGRRTAARPMGTAIRRAVRRSSIYRHARRSMPSHIVIHMVQIPQRSTRHSQPSRVLLKHEVPLTVRLRHHHRLFICQHHRLPRRPRNRRLWRSGRPQR
jgi:hypothetical protein